MRIQSTIKLDKNGVIIYNILSVDFAVSIKSLHIERSDDMLNMNNKKTQRVISAVIIGILILAMVVPMLLGM